MRVYGTLDGEQILVGHVGLDAVHENERPAGPRREEVEPTPLRQMRLAVDLDATAAFQHVLEPEVVGRKGRLPPSRPASHQTAMHHLDLSNVSQGRKSERFAF